MSDNTDQSLQSHRCEINRLDGEIVRLLNARTEHVLAIGCIKQQNHKDFYAPNREKEIFEHIKRLNAGPMTNDSLCAIYREIMSGALALQRAKMDSSKMF